jgi:HEAT repeat protein
MFLLGNNDSSKGSAPSTGEERASGAARRLPEAPGDDSHAALAAPFANNALGTAAPRVSDVMNDWRMAIIQMNAEVVERVDQMFAARPPEFVPALMASAESDPEPRVRAFSTRVLGKLRPGESTELMHKLLADRSEYVRSNAAWALGELADHDAVARLRELAKRDPAEVVRRSATESLHKLGGG